MIHTAAARLTQPLLRVPPCALAFRMPPCRKAQPQPVCFTLSRSLVQAVQLTPDVINVLHAPGLSVGSRQVHWRIAR